MEGSYHRFGALLIGTTVATVATVAILLATASYLVEPNPPLAAEPIPSSAAVYPTFPDPAGRSWGFAASDLATVCSHGRSQAFFDGYDGCDVQTGVAWGTQGHGNILRQPAEFYGSAEAARIAETVLAYQSQNGGWTKAYDRVLPRNADELRELSEGWAFRNSDTTIDNGATYTEIEFLARVLYAKREEGDGLGLEGRYRRAITDGIDFLLQAQYPNGGWPQYYPPRDGYKGYVTFNDDAMVGVLKLFSDVVTTFDQDGYLYSFLPSTYRTKAAAAMEGGLRVILQTQLSVDGKFAGWCAQYNDVTLEPAQARSYEPPSISGVESVGIVQWLMSLENPSQEVVDAIEGAVAWFDGAQIDNKWLKCSIDAETGELDRTEGAGYAAIPLWARFYDLETNAPVFQDRGGIFYASYNELSKERRVGYDYYRATANALFCSDYPQWKQRLQMAVFHPQPSPITASTQILTAWGGGSKEPYLARVCRTDESCGNLQKCEGDCDSDRECSGDLLCLQRNKDSIRSVVGCGGSALGGLDYCVDKRDFPAELHPHISKKADDDKNNIFGRPYVSRPPPGMELTSSRGKLTKVCSQTRGSCGKLEACEGDCDKDGDCAKGLVCLSRRKRDSRKVPSCDGVAQGGTDYCVLDGLR